MDYIEIKLPKATVYLTAGEINNLLQKDTQLFSEALKRGKYIHRHQQQKSRESQKYEREGQGF
jgi:Zn-finger nucleic acid-binding protein